MVQGETVIGRMVKVMHRTVLVVDRTVFPRPWPGAGQPAGDSFAVASIRPRVSQFSRTAAPASTA